MILICIETTCFEKAILDYENVYLYLKKNTEEFYSFVEDDIIYILIYNDQEYFKICLEMMLVLDNEELSAKFYISQSNELIDLSDVVSDKMNYQVFNQNFEARKKYLKNRTFSKNNHFVIRAHHQMLDSILYSLSVMCFKYERNIEMLYDKYYGKMTQKEIANKYDITQAAVSKKLKSSNYEMFKLLVGRL